MEKEGFLSSLLAIEVTQGVTRNWLIETTFIKPVRLTADKRRIVSKVDN